MESFRNFVRGWFGRAFLTAVLVLFVVMMFWNVSPAGSQGELAKVDGVRIFKPELDRAVETVMQKYGKQFDRRTLEQLVPRDMVLERLIREHATIETARKMGVVVDPRTLQDTVKSIPAFRDEAGNFSQERFQQAILRNGYANAADFRHWVEDDLLAEQMQGAINDSAFATRQDLEQLTRMGEQKRDIAWVVLSPSAFAGKVSVADSELKARYDANPGGYLTEEKLSVEYVEVKLDDYAGSQQVTDEAVRGKYDDMVKKANENAERRVAHILVAINKDRNEAAAKTRADEVLARLAKGESFAALAKEYSDDKGSSENGGDLGYIGRGVLEKALDSAVATLKVNDVSSTIKASDGFHLVKVLDARQVQVPSFESSKADILASLKRERAREKFDEVVADLGTQAYESDNLHDPAKKLGLQIHDTPMFGRSGGPGIAANRKVLEEILAPEVLEEGRNSGVIEVAEGDAVVVHLKDHQKAERRPFAEVAGTVRNELVQEKAAALAKETARSLQSSLAAGKTLDEVAKAGGYAVQHVAGAQRASHDVPPEVLKAAFAAAWPAKAVAAQPSTTVDMVDGSHAVLVVSSVVDGTLLGMSDQETHRLRAQLAGQFGQQDYTHFTDAALAASDVVRFKSNDKDKQQGDAAPKPGDRKPKPAAPASSTPAKNS